MFQLKLTYGETKTLRVQSCSDGNDIDDIVLQIGKQLKAVFPLLPMEYVFRIVIVSSGNLIMWV